MQFDVMMLATVSEKISKGRECIGLWLVVGLEAAAAKWGREQALPPTRQGTEVLERAWQVYAAPIVIVSRSMAGINVIDS
jgi:hypothetical protein